MEYMFLHVGTVDIGIVKVADQMVNQFGFSVDMVIHETLEKGGGIHETKSHDVELIWTVRGNEHG
jgi:hypothetical protein